MEKDNGFKIIGGNSNPDLVRKIRQLLGAKDCKADIGSFSDGETKVNIEENVRGCHVFVVQSLCKPVNDHLMELCLILDALKRASCKRVVAVIPYFGYARQDRKARSRAPISAKMVADFISTAGADRVITFDLHSGQIQGFFNIPVDNLFASKVFLSHIREGIKVHNDNNDIVMVSPDDGGVERARAYAKRLNCGLAIIYKKRSAPNAVEKMILIGEVEEKDCIVVDDMIDTAGTLTNGAELLMEEGARTVTAYATHPVLSGPAIDRINNSPFKSVFVTDTIPLDYSNSSTFCRKIGVISIAGPLTKAIENTYRERSISELFEDKI